MWYESAVIASEPSLSSRILAGVILSQKMSRIGRDARPPHPRLPQMTSRGSGAAAVIQAVRSWCSIDVDAIACARTECRRFLNEYFNFLVSDTCCQTVKRPQRSGLLAQKPAHVNQSAQPTCPLSWLDSSSCSTGHPAATAACLQVLLPFTERGESDGEHL